MSFMRNDERHRHGFPRKPRNRWLHWACLLIGATIKGKDGHWYGYKADEQYRRLPSKDGSAE